MKIRFAFLFVLILMYGCFNTNDSMVFDSDNYWTKEKRIKILKAEIKWPSDFYDTEFELFNINGFTNGLLSQPGPSSVDYKFAIKVNKSDLDKWIKGMTKLEDQDYDTSWINKIIEKRKENWVCKNQFEIFVRKNTNVTVLICRDQELVFKRIITN